MCVSNQFCSEKVRARAKTKHKPEKIHKVNLVEYYCFNACSFHFNRYCECALQDVPRIDNLLSVKHFVMEKVLTNCFRLLKLEDFHHH